MGAPYWLLSGVNTFSIHDFLDDYLILMWAEIKETHRAFLESLADRPRITEPNPLPILMRAVNSVKARYSIKQNRWSSRRWKSTT